MNARTEAQLLELTDPRWLAFLASRPEAHIFHHPAWQTVLAECYGYRPIVLAVCDRAGRDQVTASPMVTALPPVTAGLPMMEVRTGIGPWHALGGRRWVALPFTDYCPPLYEDALALEQLAAGLVERCEREQAGASWRGAEVRWALPPCPPIQPYLAYTSHRVPLGPDPLAVMKRFDRTHRQNVAAAEERGVRIEWGTGPEAVAAFYDLQLATRRRKGLPVQPRRFFDLIARHLFSEGLGFILLAYRGAGEPLAGGLFLRYGQTLVYKYAASSGGAGSVEQQLRPNNLLTWTAILWGCENGCTAFDLGRTDLGNAGLRRFKRGWGAEETEVTYCTLADARTRVEQPAPAPAAGRLAAIAGPVIQKSPPWVCRAVGELLYGRFGG